MADRIAETRNGRKEEAEAATESAPTPAPAKPAASMSRCMPLIITALVMPALAFATTRFVLVPQMKNALSQPAASTEATPPAAPASGAAVIEGKPKLTVPLNKILVNVAGTMGTRYLLTSVTLVGNDENFKNKIEQNKDQLQDLASGTLSTKTISDLEKPGERNEIRAELMTIFNNALGGSFIKEIYITELAVQ